MKEINFACGSLGNNQILKKRIGKSIEEVDISGLLNYSDSLGMTNLREEILKLHNFKLKKENIMITSSSQQALNLIFEYILKKSSIKFFVQEPSYFGIHRISRNKEIEIISFKDINKIFNNLDSKKLNVIYVTSNFSSPDGRSLNIKEKKKLSKLAKNNNVLILEDNPYNSLYYGSSKPKNIFDYSSKNIIFVGSLSKVIAPGLRVGYIVAEEEKIKSLKPYKINSDIFTSTLDQQVCYNVLKDQKYLKYLRREYLKKRDLIVELLEKKLKYYEEGTWEVPKGGIFIQINLNKQFSVKKLVGIALKKGLHLEEDIYYYNDKKSRNSFRINFVQNSFSGIKEGINKLADSIRELKNGI